MYFSKGNNFLYPSFSQLAVGQIRHQGEIQKPEIMRISKLSKKLKFGEGVAEIIALLLRATSFSDTLYKPSIHRQQEVVD